MKFIVLAALLLCGCATFELPDATYSLPEVIYQPSLPPWPYHTDNVSLNLTFRVHVAVDGSVNNALIETPSGSKEWDSVALSQVRKWRYSPALMNGQPATLWLRQTITIHFDKPLYMMIGEITCHEQELADSLHALLVAGASFDSLARQFSISDSRDHGGVIGEMDLHTLPINIWRKVSSLQAGEISKPLKLGRHFVIYKRLADGA
jgi:TonB family protein